MSDFKHLIDALREANQAENDAYLNALRHKQAYDASAVAHRKTQAIVAEAREALDTAISNETKP